MSANLILVSKGLAFISSFLLVGFYTSHYLKSAVSDGYVHSGNLNDVGWTGLMGGDEEGKRIKRSPEEEGANTAVGTGDSEDDPPPIPDNMAKFKRSSGSDDDETSDEFTFGKDFTDDDADDDSDEDEDEDEDEDDFWKTVTSGMSEESSSEMTTSEESEETTTGVTVTGSTDAMTTGTDSTDETDVTGSETTPPVTGSTEEPTSSIPTTVEPTTEQPTTVEVTTLPPRNYMRTVEPKTLTKCQAQPYTIQDACPTGGGIEFVSTVNVTMEELSKVLFDVDVLAALENRCDNSTWCLGHEYDKILWYSSKMYKSYCNFIPCLLEVPDDCLTEERRLSTATLILLCESDLSNITNPCLLSLRRMSHVSFLSLYRSRDEDMYDTICSDKYAKKCSGPCYEYSHQLYCTYDSCNASTMWIFQDYGPWQWLFNDVDKMEKCDVASTNCSAFQPPPYLFVAVPDNFRTRILAKIMDMDNKLVIGILTSLFVAFVAFGLVVYACIKKIRKDSNRGHIEYSRLTKEDELEDA